MYVSRVPILLEGSVYIYIYIYVYTVYMLSPCLLCLCPISVAHVHLFSSAVSAVCHFPAFQFPATVLEILDIALTTS